jgi:hypothetical protein
MTGWTIEAAGGTIGSVVGYGIGVGIADEDECEDEVGCILTDMSGVLFAASAGATLGTWALGSAADTSPSFWGATLGSIVGAAAGLGILEVLDQIDPDWDEGTAAVVGFTVTQGVFTAIGSRVAKSFR